MSNKKTEIHNLALEIYFKGITLADLKKEMDSFPPSTMFDLSVLREGTYCRVPVGYALETNNVSAYDASIWGGLSPEECREQATMLIPFKDSIEAIMPTQQLLSTRDVMYNNYVPSLEFMKRIYQILNDVDAVLKKLGWEEMGYFRSFHARDGRKKVIITFYNNGFKVRSAKRHEMALVRC